jgi:hypothetical protein
MYPYIPSEKEKGQTKQYPGIRSERQKSTWNAINEQVSASRQAKSKSNKAIYRRKELLMR